LAFEKQTAVLSSQDWPSQEAAFFLGFCLSEFILLEHRKKYQSAARSIRKYFLQEKKFHAGLLPAKARD